jgi:group II intron reverse transcriptase/maturase
VERRPFAAMSAMRKAALKIRYGNRVPVVVRGREIRPHGEGEQSVSQYKNRKGARGTMRNPVHVLKSLEEKARTEGYKYERLYRNLYNPEFYLQAYQNISQSQGSMTPGADGMTLDDMSMARINSIIASLKDHSYQPNPARRTYIAKKNSTKKRPLGIPSTNDKLVQEVVRMILEAIYEPTFSANSHGFRPQRSCHTALKEIKTTFSGAKWIVEGDIKACFDSFDHHVMIDLLRRRIKDEHFIALMWKFLRAGYMEQWIYHETYSGTPQGSGMSPVLSNIYLNELDAFMEGYKLKFNAETKHNRPASKEYESARRKYRKAKSELEADGTPENVRDFKENQKKLLGTPYYPAIDPDFKRVQYNRYADDFLIGVIGSKDDAERVKADVKQFLQEMLKLTMSEEKTKVTHSSELVRYLGYDITVSRSQDTKRDEKGVLRRVWSGKVRLYVPKEKWIAKLHEYNAFKIVKDENGKEKWKPTHRGYLMNKPEVDIVSKYNSEIRGIYNYYRLATNVSVLNKFYFMMSGSLYKTIAAKYNTSVNKILDKYKKGDVFSVTYTTKAGQKQCELYHDGFTWQADETAPAYVDILPQYRHYDKPNSLAMRLKKGVCEMCGAETKEIHMHHVKRLKDLTGETEAELLMMQKRRKSLALCWECYEKVRTYQF